MGTRNPNYLYHLKDDEPRRLIKPATLPTIPMYLDGTNYLQDTRRYF